jgi:DME family drug/metabolite transporter
MKFNSSRAEPDSRMVGYASVLLAGLCWSSSGFFATQILTVSQASATALAFWRDLGTFVCLLVYHLTVCPGKLRIPRGCLPWLIAMGASLGFFHILLNVSYLVNGVAVTTVQQAAMPAFVAVAARYFWAEPLSLRKTAAILLTIAGTFLSTGVIDGLTGGVWTWSFWLGFLVPLFYAAWSLLGKRLRMEVDALVALLFAFGVASLVLLPLQPFTGQPQDLGLDVLVPYGGLVLITTIAGFGLFMFGLSRIPAGVASILAMSELVFVAILTYLLLDERLSTVQVFGTTLVVSGVLVIIRKGEPVKTKPGSGQPH